MDLQCCTCETVFTKPDEDNTCPNCGSGNWVEGYIDEPEPIDQAIDDFSKHAISKMQQSLINYLRANKDDIREALIVE